MSSTKHVRSKGSKAAIRVIQKYKLLLEGKCHQLKDQLTVVVMVNAISDLHAVDAQYHLSCSSKFHTQN